ncbi:hypothetical protein H5410_006867 [Solanum commersonii]|uniref:Uncharacterized protein n=1 Tax=Solanum commersonii TaxID=4109 RepID=A0A9J6AB06_SOLCO|nr:hypothetical protein H5410_006867 [Solanum commersonii]
MSSLLSHPRFWTRHLLLLSSSSMRWFNLSSLTFDIFDGDDEKITKMKRKNEEKKVRCRMNSAIRLLVSSCLDVLPSASSRLRIIGGLQSLPRGLMATLYLLAFLAV